ncbi:unnamed protein product [Protopolystoma xenopodis]|uniref:Dynein heavy chain C-terminal domain-containing protein n=1 Tax=Protopolystoma xenopodis TaxID=117903 RepID=A0A448WPR9_9PLAT|nr:unnamed protein product [Protopolystoma xenopodis]
MFVFSIIFIWQTWLERADAGRLLSFDEASASALDLADLFRPSSFLNAVCQETATRLRLAMDQLVLVVTNWATIKQNHLEARSRLGESSLSSDKAPLLRITGLQLEGALFDEQTHRLTGTKADSPTLTTIPDVFIAWVTSVKACIS